MNVLLAHAYYQERGGEDAVFERERDLLSSHGIEVHSLVRYNRDLGGLGRLAQLRRTWWNADVYAEAQAMIRAHDIDVLHVTNITPGLSPSIYHAAADAGVPIVQSVHNYRPTGCLNGLFLAGGQVCERCSGKCVSWPGMIRGCYRGSRLTSSVMAATRTAHSLWKSPQSLIARWIALTNFAREKLIAGGLPAERVVVKPNFLPITPAVGPGDGGYALFVGRLSAEKGVQTLIQGWQRCPDAPRLMVAGDGPERTALEQQAMGDDRIEFVGALPAAQVLDYMSRAAFLVIPSEWYEVFPLTILEAQAVGTPIVASNIGNLPDLVTDGETGWLFAPGDPEGLAKTVQQVLQDRPRWPDFRRAARRRFEEIGTAAQNFELLVAIYEQVVAARPAVLAP